MEGGAGPDKNKGDTRVEATCRIKIYGTNTRKLLIKIVRDKKIGWRQQNVGAVKWTNISYRPQELSTNRISADGSNEKPMM